MPLLSVEKLSEATHARQLGNELQRTYKWSMRRVWTVSRSLPS
jgi:hypothetical protein